MNASALSSVGQLQSLASLPVHSVLGVDVIILSGGADTGGAFSSYHATCGKGAGAPPHLHRDADEAFLLLEGEFDLLCGEQVQRGRAGDYIYIPRGVVHAFTGVSENPAKLLGLCTPAGHEEFFRDAAELAARGEMQPEAVAALCERHQIELVM